MMKGIGAAALAVALAAGCGDDGPTNPPPPPPATLAVTTGSQPPPRFIPATGRVAVGGTVTWTSGSPEGITHNVKSNTNVWPLTTLESGESFSHTFPTAGSFPYECTLHAGMTGVIRVE